SRAGRFIEPELACDVRIGPKVAGSTVHRFHGSRPKEDKMPTTPYVYEFGMGMDVHGSDSTTAARRAVFDAIRHSSLPVLRQIREQGGEMLVHALIGVPNAASVDLEAVKAEFPHGVVTVEAVEG